MIRALLLIFDPSNTWDRIQNKPYGLARVFLVSIVPLLLVTSAVEGYGLITFGRERGVVRKTKPVPVEVAVRYEVIQFGISLVLLFGGGWMLKTIGESFHRRHTFQESFATAAYSLSPLFLCRMFNAIPGLSLWITWGAGIFLVMAALYRGIPRLMRPDPSNALGLYIMASLGFFLVSGVANYLAIQVLDEQILTDFNPIPRLRENY